MTIFALHLQDDRRPRQIRADAFVVQLGRSGVFRRSATTRYSDEL
jgi:hypothetical protein